MADGDGATATALRSLSHRKEARDSSDGVDSISSLPDDILQIILSTIPTKFAIRTSVLSRRWRHVWLDTPSLSFDSYTLKADSINKTLTRYKVQKMMSFVLYTSMIDNVPYIDRWIEFAMSRNVENMSLVFGFHTSDKYNIPDFFFKNSVVKQLSLKLHFTDMIPTCSVSWASLKKLSLISYKLSSESIAKILSGCPVLESLKLYLYCNKLRVLDLSNSPGVRALEIDSNVCVQEPGPMQIVVSHFLPKIVAPHIYYFRSTKSPSPCTLVDVSSLIEVKLDIGICPLEILYSGFLEVRVIKMLAKFQNVEKFTFGANFLKILSLAELGRIPFPMLKVKYLKFDTMISQYAIPGIVKVLQNSPELKKLSIHTMESGTIPEKVIDKYLDIHGLNNPNQCWSSKERDSKNTFRWNVEAKHVASFMELMLKTTKTLENMVFNLGGYLKGRSFEELFEMVQRLSRDYNVSIALIA